MVPGAAVLSLHIIDFRDNCTLNKYRSFLRANFSGVPNDSDRFWLVSVVFIFPIALTRPSFNNSAWVNTGMISST